MVPHAEPVPEGPYELAGDAGPAGLANRSTLHIVNTVDRLIQAVRRNLELPAGLRDLPAILHLVQSHLSGRLVTRASRGDAAGL